MQIIKHFNLDALDSELYHTYYNSHNAYDVHMALINIHDTIRDTLFYIDSVLIMQLRDKN